MPEYNFEPEKIIQEWEKAGWVYFDWDRASYRYTEAGRQLIPVADPPPNYSGKGPAYNVEGQAKEEAKRRRKLAESHAVEMFNALKLVQKYMRLNMHSPADVIKTVEDVYERAQVSPNAYRRKPAQDTGDNKNE